MQFLYPNVLWMLLLPAILLIVLIATNKTSMQIFFSAEVLDKLRVNTKSLRHETRNIIFFCALILMVLALARPVAPKQEFEAKQELIPIVVALDISRSMLSNDIYPNRLELAKRKLKHLISNVQNSAIGVVLFAKSSFIMSPITQDLATLLYMVDHLDKGMNFDNGSNIASMIQTSIDLMSEYQNKNIILLSDGTDEENFEKEIQLAKKNGVNIYAIGLATTQGGPIPLEDGSLLTNDEKQIVVVKLNNILKDLAMQSGGGYIDFSLGNKDVDMILSDIYTKSKKDQFESQKIKQYLELFYYPLALALFLLLIAFSSLPKKMVVSLFIVFLAVYPNKIYASIFDFQVIQEANKAYENQEYEKAQKGFQEVARNAQGYYNYANSLYKQGKYEQALKQYEKVVTKDKELEFKKLHNMGNSAAMLKKYDKAEEFYEKALKIHNDEQTKQNLEMVKNQQKQEQEKENNDQNDSSDNEQENDQNDTQNEQEKQKENKNQNNQNENNKKENEKQENKNDSNQKNEQNEQNEQTIEQTNMEQISTQEEEKWMKMLQEQEVPILLHKVPNSVKEDDVKNPW